MASLEARIAGGEKAGFAEWLLTLKAADVEDLRKFRWLESPEEQALAHGKSCWEDLGAIESPKLQNPKSKVGRQYSAFSAWCFSLTARIGRICRYATVTRITDLGRKKCSRFLSTPATRACCWPLRNTDACIRLPGSRFDSRSRSIVAQRGQEHRQQSEDLLGEKANSDFWI